MPSVDVSIHMCTHVLALHVDGLMYVGGEEREGGREGGRKEEKKGGREGGRGGGRKGRRKRGRKVYGRKSEGGRVKWREDGRG